jgi:hypothetical protein
MRVLAVPEGTALAERRAAAVSPIRKAALEAKRVLRAKLALPVRAARRRSSAALETRAKVAPAVSRAARVEPAA